MWCYSVIRPFDRKPPKPVSDEEYAERLERARRMAKQGREIGRMQDIAAAESTQERCK